jgi:hypothetical protein
LAQGASLSQYIDAGIIPVSFLSFRPFSVISAFWSSSFLVFPALMLFRLSGRCSFTFVLATRTPLKKLEKWKRTEQSCSLPVYSCAAEAIFCCPTENSHHLEKCAVS